VKILNKIDFGFIERSWLTHNPIPYTMPESQLIPYTMPESQQIPYTMPESQQIPYALPESQQIPYALPESQQIPYALPESQQIPYATRFRKMVSHLSSKHSAKKRNHEETFGEEEYDTARYGQPIPDNYFTHNIGHGINIETK
jgi:hypothetical protein